jgi:SAM-dependent methyltransferase
MRNSNGSRLRLTPPRSRGVEILDDPAVEAGIVRRSHADIRLANRLFGGRRAVLAELEPLLRAAPGTELTLLDVGSGCGDIPKAARALAERYGTTLRIFGLDSSLALVSTANADLPMTLGTALKLPFKDSCIDIVICSQLLHHFDESDADAVLREMNRVGRKLVLVSDLRRSWIAAAGIWLASWALFFHPVSRHDGVVSVMRGYTVREMSALVSAATGARAAARSRSGFRVAAAWRPGEAA